ncbi:multidrug efflux system ATP-binding protein Rv1218c [Paraliobacillus ryukyuensis]|uniref:ABC-2 type transport system ATP-binding protein n=1 Tax=Paraliobacillus ryukyuensis TaxID=200904 RepID=A0A366DZB7_9BACI|nr:ABC transporter ATP-binding protein [Paraliobacillus ryukyuensis]RBO95215.1 ABC-2 type transport system ATP-binding protein [Paraliobacillus ryukyuensis]
MTIMKVSNLRKDFGAFTALDGVDIEVKQGEVYGFIGPNGAGKSTTIRILLGLLQATSGEVKIFGKNAWTDAVAIHKRLAYVPGDVNLWPNLTGGEVIDIFLRMRGKTIDREKRDALIKKFDFDPTKKCRTYSKGNRQKVALIAAFAADADLYILDEPTSGLDPLMERVFQSCVEEAKQAGASIFLSSHILSEVEQLCDRVGIIRQGKIIETGTLAELRYLTSTQLMVETKQLLTNLATYPGIHDIDQEGNVSRFKVDSDQLDAVMQHVSSFGITKLESMPPTLEDLFIRHYEKTGDDGGER